MKLLKTLGRIALVLLILTTIVLGFRESTKSQAAYQQRALTEGIEKGNTFKKDHKEEVLEVWKLDSKQCAAAYKRNALGSGVLVFPCRELQPILK